ncbi:MAG: hypothetical protein OEY22_02130 [Candidatus Bathyarchaeota archaeon]|nr:hypothetical protein [Candidatus Bathyarchaeota archaeon]MDH5788353.1 hypothetical protein [Candidatus Bathyarchaeota archaeon]
MSQRKLQQSEVQFLQEAMNADYSNADIRLREGEYQYELARTTASFQLELCFPDVKDIIRRLYGEEKANDIQFVRKIQTILKKLEKNNIVKILPKRKPWELQRYALPSFKFRDVNRNSVIFATDQQIKQAQDLLQSISAQYEISAVRLRNLRIRICMLLFAVGASYLMILWNFMQPIINPAVFILAFSVAVACSLMLGKTLSR